MVGGMDIEQGGLTAEQGEKSQSGYSFMQVVFLYFLLLEVQRNYAYLLFTSFKKSLEIAPKETSSNM